MSAAVQRILRHATVALASAAVMACAHRPSLVEGREALDARQASFLAAMQERSAERLVAHFADDAVLHVANMPAVRGRVAIRQFYGNVFRFLASSTGTIEDVRVAAGADMAYGTGRVTNVFGSGAQRTEFAGKFLLVWERREGEWMITVYSVSSDRAEPSR